MDDSKQQVNRLLSRTLNQLAGGFGEQGDKAANSPLVGQMTGNIIFMGEASADALEMIFKGRAAKRARN